MALPTAILTQNTITVPVEEYGDPQLDASPVVGAPQALSLALQVPVVTIEYNNPGEFPLTLMLENPTPTNTIIPATETLVLAVHAPTLAISNSITPSALGLVLALQTPSLTIDSQVFAPTFNIVATGPYGLSPTIGYLTVTSQRTLRDPIVVGGCPQCGTFLYPKKGRDMPTEAVSIGRNFENVKDDQFIRCGRCGFLVKRSRHPAMPDRSRAGWGINYTEVDAGESDISYP